MIMVMLQRKGLTFQGVEKHLNGTDATSTNGE